MVRRAEDRHSRRDGGARRTEGEQQRRGGRGPRGPAREAEHGERSQILAVEGNPPSSGASRRGPISAAAASTLGPVVCVGVSAAAVGHHLVAAPSRAEVLHRAPSSRPWSRRAAAAAERRPTDCAQHAAARQRPPRADAAPARRPPHTRRATRRTPNRRACRVASAQSQRLFVKSEKRRLSCSRHTWLRTQVRRAPQRERQRAEAAVRRAECAAPRAVVPAQTAARPTTPA